MKYARASLAVIASLSVAALISREFAAQDILHVSVHSTVTEFYRVSVDTGRGFPATASSSALLFPSELVDGSPRINFPLPGNARKLQISLGETPGNTVSGIEICLERSFVVSRCLRGNDLTRFIENVSDGKLLSVDGFPRISALGARPTVTFSPTIFDELRPERDAWTGIARTLFFLLTALFLFCFFFALSMPAFAWLTWDALWLFLAAGSLRVFAFSEFAQRVVSDSDLFLRYLRAHIFTLPGIRGIVYPIFTSLFRGDADSIVKAQLFLGAVGSVIVLLLIRSFKTKSRWDLLFALAATSVPSLIAMEDLVLSESFSLFLILSIFLVFRWTQKSRTNLLSIAGLGAACALLTQTKPQFSFVWILFAVAIAGPVLWRGQLRPAIGQLLVFGAPSLALYLFAVTLDFSCGNFRGVSSTLGYSLFDHGQLAITCPTNLPDPHAEILCKARAALGPDGDPTGYTAWAIYPSMRNLGEPFYRVTGSLAKLSIQLISTHFRLYLQSAITSFVRFWTGGIPMTRTYLLSKPKPSPLWQEVMATVISIDRWYRDLVVAAFFFLTAAAFVLRFPADRADFVFIALMSLLAVTSSILQALVEYGLESARFEIPTEPLLAVVVIYLALNLYSRIVRPSRAAR